MLFNSYIFILLFLPLVLAGWFLLNKFRKYDLAQWYLVGMSLWFYGYFNVSYLPVILASCLVNFLFSRLLHQRNTTGVRRFVLFGGIFFNLGVLFYFKYFDFFVSNSNALFGTDFVLQHMLLPLGISFFTFQQLSFVIDRARGKALHYRLVDYLSYATFFPQLASGPIVLHSELIPQFQDRARRHFRVESFTMGVAQFVTGMAKKVLLADTLAQIVNYGYEYSLYMDTPAAVLVMLSFTFELYFDFSGYSDMAVGLGKMFNMEIPQNFASPYKSRSIKEFWRRWHITLGRFLTTYLYIPLGGNRRGRGRMVINTMLVFLASGLWHGANWTYVVWGGLHGAAVAVNGLWMGRKSVRPESNGIGSVKPESNGMGSVKPESNGMGSVKPESNGIGSVKPESNGMESVRPGSDGMQRNGTDRKRTAGNWIRNGMSWLISFLFVNLTFILFRSDSLEQAAGIYRLLLEPFVSGNYLKVVSALSLPEAYLAEKVFTLLLPGAAQYFNVALTALILLVCGVVTAGKRTEGIVTECRFGSLYNWWIVILFVWCILSLSGVSTFLYFNF